MGTPTACEALNSGLALELGYDGYNRIVEVHAVGYTKDGNAVMRVWQVSGGSVSGEVPGWKLLRFDKVTGLAISDVPSEAPRPDYKRGDKAMQEVICEL